MAPPPFSSMTGISFFETAPNTLEVDLVNLIPCFLGLFGKRNHLGTDTGVIMGEIELSVRLHRLLNHLLDIQFLAHIGLNKRSLTALFFDLCYGFTATLFVNICDDYFRTFFSEPLGGCTTDS